MICFFSIRQSVFCQSNNIPSSSKSIAERVAGHNFPSIVRPWGNCIDFNDNKRNEEITHHDLSWESIGKEKSKLGDRIAGANWSGKYPALGESFSNLTEALENRKEALAKNPNMVMLAELRWRDYMDSLLPADHEFWKRDAQGNRVLATGDKMALPRYFLDTNNINLVNHLLQQAKYMVESGVYDGVFLDWFGPSAGFFKKLRDVIGDKYLIITNANYKYDAERAKYINGAYLECYKTNNPDALPLWEQSVRSPKINVVDMMGEQVNCVGDPDLKRMRNTTTFSLIHSNGYTLYGDHYHLHHWFPFWDLKLGSPLSDKQLIEKGVFKRAFKKGFVVNNSSGKTITVNFESAVKRGSNNEIGKSFQIYSDDGDIFKKLPVIVWQPSHQTNTGVDFSEAATCNAIVEAAMETNPHLEEYKVWSFGESNVHHANVGSNTAISETSAIVDGKISGYAFELQEANKHHPQVLIAVHNNGGTKRNAVWGYIHYGDSLESANRTLAARLIKAISAATDLENRGVLLDSTTGRNDYRCSSTGKLSFYMSSPEIACQKTIQNDSQSAKQV